ncbi:hypothetical protein [Rhizobium rhizoryzae]|uniref:Uncharacterized protein n=1 Tax=Rhizobium rhizoryzae TaxID=451876 RepID=A0A7W6LKE5_9HYPH|nr:hypothetical protein [Rhizobium rhizoryzae]MBB4146019.1 hypothetical protein [Rhizobium rhizoryzae]
MALSINVTALTAIGGVRQIMLNIVAPVEAGGLPYLGLGSVEIWASSTNNRAAAAKVGQTSTGQFIHSDLPSGVITRYYWARAVNVAGTPGNWHPASATAGVPGTTVATTPGPNSIGNAELQDGAVSTSKVSSIDAYKINASSLSAISANLGFVTAGTVTGALIQTSTGSTRVEVSNYSNALDVYSDGRFMLRLGGSGGIALTLRGPLDAFVSNYGVAAEINNYGGYSTSHGMRSRSSGGGMGLVGVSAGGGGYAFYAEVGSYGPFTGSHDALISKASDVDLGEIVCDVRVLSRKGIDDTLTEVERSSQRGQKAVIGVVSRRVACSVDIAIAGLNSQSIREHLALNYDRLTINAVGEGQISVCGRGGNLDAGDLIISSDLPGKGERQADDVVRSITVAKVREAVTFDYPDQCRLVACIYLCG